MHNKTATEIHKHFIDGTLSAQAICKHFIKRCKEVEPSINALILLLEERAMKQAKMLDEKKARGEEVGLLAGVPVIIKDNMHIKGEKTTCASKMLENYTAPFDATVTRLIEEEDGIIIGKSNLDEFAMGSSTEYSYFKNTNNPWNTECSPGGSSGGSAAAVAGLMAPLSLGSDTGGSIRQPAAFCGVAGFKPTYGRVSRHGLVAFASSLDQIGPFAQSVEDIALMMNVIGKYCERDSTSINEEEDYTKHLGDSLKGKVIGIPQHLIEYTSDEGKEHFVKGIEKLKSLGATIDNSISLAFSEYSIAIYYILATAEASTNLARYDGIRYGHRSNKATNLAEVYKLSRTEGFGKEVKRRILLGTYVLSSGYQDAYFKQAQKVRTLCIKEYKEAFKKCDFIALPPTINSAFKRGENIDPIEMYRQDLFTISANLAGLPAISIPTGLTKDQLPMGIQLQAWQKEDANLLNCAHQLEKSLQFSDLYRIPNIEVKRG